MLTAERYQRILDCNGVAEVKKCLSEFGFEGETTDEMFTRALDGIYAYLTEGSPLETVRRAIVKKNDYHNAKVMAKCKYTRRQITADLLYPYGDVDVKRMEECVMNDEYALLPAPMAKALSEVDLRFSKGERSGRLIDCLLNQAMYEDIFATLGAKYGELAEVYQAEVDFANLSVALRIRKNGLPMSVLNEEWIGGGSLKKADFDKVIHASVEEAALALRNSKLKEIIVSALQETEKDAFIDFEKLADNYVITLLKKYRNDNGHYMMFYGYVLARLYELKNVRIAVGGVKAGKDKNETRAKLRDLYVG
jgi:vacuolar-type H+-ATPase subunit C/Vma6